MANGAAVECTDARRDVDDIDKRERKKKPAVKTAPLPATPEGGLYPSSHPRVPEGRYFALHVDPRADATTHVEGGGRRGDAPCCTAGAGQCVKAAPARVISNFRASTSDGAHICALLHDIRSFCAQTPSLRPPLTVRAGLTPLRQPSNRDFVFLAPAKVPVRNARRRARPSTSPSSTRRWRSRPRVLERAQA